MADMSDDVNRESDELVGEIYVLRYTGGMERYKLLINSECLSCGKWLCVMAGTYTGEIRCNKCGAVNMFRDTSKPCEAKAA